MLTSSCFQSQQSGFVSEIKFGSVLADCTPMNDQSDQDNITLKFQKLSPQNRLIPYTRLPFLHQFLESFRENNRKFIQA